MTAERPGAVGSAVLVHAYLDGELSVTEALEAERAITTDSALAAEAEAVRALKKALGALPPDVPSARFVDSIERRFGIRRLARPSWMALAASMVLAIGLSSALTFGLVRGT